MKKPTWVDLTDRQIKATATTAERQRILNLLYHHATNSNPAAATALRWAAMLIQAHSIMIGDDQ